VVRERERIEDALRAVENDLMSTGVLLNQERERYEDRRHEARMLEMRGHLARLRVEHKIADKRGLIYKITYNARR
jgi:hypothetical protein